MLFLMEEGIGFNNDLGITDEICKIYEGGHCFKYDAYASFWAE